MQKGRVHTVIWIGALAIIVVALLLYLFLPTGVEYSDDPVEWVDTHTDGAVVIDVEEASQGGSSYYEGLANQRVPVQGGEVTGIAYFGAYKGQVFNKNAVENSEIVMHIGPELNPQDGVIDTFAVVQFDPVLTPGTLVPEKLVIYVDQDWVDRASNLNIIWGPDVANIAGMNQRPFNFSTAQNGVYIDSIDTDIEWTLMVDDRPQGRVFVGDISKEDLLNTDVLSDKIFLTLV
ncbi:hypothetical protein GF342_05035 [Candidatus Woesearchaeota archaeon]|nr:hypothetical protein [Candidatus Woesearchaeota archaeon]